MTARLPTRLPLMALGMVALVTGIWGGLLRMGWALPAHRTVLIVGHGPLMVSGFLGTLIGLERAVALGRAWGYAGPLLTGVGALAVIAGLPETQCAGLFTAGSLVLVAIFAVFIRQQPALFAVTMGLGTVCWCIGNSVWLAGRPLFGVVSWWMGFLVLTIAGERLELSRLVQVARASRWVFVGIVGVFLAGLTHSGVATAAGARLTGLALIAMTVWLLRYDIARRTVRLTGLPRFTAVSLLSGYLWLGIGGLLMLYFGGVIGGLDYDAVLHAVFLGFVFAMIFGHAPIIFPAVLGLAVPFRSVFYAHLAVLHLSLVLRVAGDLVQSQAFRQWGGLLNGVAVIYFLVNTVWSVRRGMRAVRQAPERPATLGASA